MLDQLKGEIVDYFSEKIYNLESTNHPHAGHLIDRLVIAEEEALDNLES